MKISGAPTFHLSHPEFAKVVCLTRITTRDLDDGLLNKRSEINIGLSSSNFASKLETFWPKQKSDCPEGSSYDEGYANNKKRTQSCDVPITGGALNVNNLCTSIYNKDYVLGLRVREIDNGGDGDDFSMFSLKASEMLPTLTSDGKTLTDSSL